MGLIAGNYRIAAAVLTSACVVASAVGAVAGAPAASAAGTAAVVLPAAPIGHAGRWVTDADGRVLVVSGVNMVNKLTPYTPAADGFDDADGAFLAANGLSAVRVGIIWKALEPEPGVFDDAYLASIASTVNMLGSHGIVSLLDFHQDMYNEKFQGEGAPDWAVDQSGPVFPLLGFSANYFLLPALMTAYDNFWANATVDGKGLQDWYAGAWQHVASYFNGNPYVLGYDLYNEPDPGSTIYSCLLSADGCPSFDATLTSFYTKVDTAIRQVNTTALLFGEPTLLFDIGNPSSLGSTGDANSGFSFHLYCPFASVSALLDFACPSSDSATLSNAEAVSSRTQDALLMTEFGATSDTSILSEDVAAAASAKVGWMMWAMCYCGDPTTSSSTEGLVSNLAQAPSGSNVNTAMLDALAVPHPDLVSGTPGSYAYNTSTHVFTLSYSTERADGTGAFAAGSQTSISVPAVQYTSGYQVAVSGGTVVSTGGVLQVASCRGATSVTVTVSPGSGTSGSC